MTIKTEILPNDHFRGRYANATDGYYVCISIADTGMGMDRTTKDRIFEPFFTTKELGKGTGLGLAVVYGVVTSHRGFIDVDTHVGSGTTFKLYLPLSQSVPDAIAAEDKVTDVAPGGSETLLLVEDEEALLELMQALLEGKGYRVLVAKDGKEAVDLYTQYQKSIALVLTDIGLPLLGGQAVVTALTGLNPKVKIIVASGFLDPDVKNELTIAGAKEFVQKPYLPDEVLKTIRTLIDAA